MSKRQIAQEYLCDFNSSGETFLGATEIEWIRKCVTAPVSRDGDDKNVWIWKYPLSEHNYIVSADVARGDSKDYSTFHVIDVEEGEVVAEYKGKIRPDNFAELLSVWGHKYNKALLCPENNSFGYATILKLQEMQYPKLYYRKRKQVFIGGYVPKQSADIAGFTTNGKTRSMILGKLEEIIRNKQLIIRSSRTYEEIKTFTWKTGRAEAKRGFHDDLVMSLAIGTWLYDASADYSKSSKSLNQAMINAMSSTRNDLTDIMSNSKDKFTRQEIEKRKVNIGSKIPDEYLWVIK
jgi:hypothetical protein